MGEVSYTVRKDLDEAECKAELVTVALQMVDAIIASIVAERMDEQSIGWAVGARVGVHDFNLVVEFRNGGADTYVALKVAPEE